MEKRDDETLCQAALTGDVSAWDALIGRYDRKVVVSLLGRGVRLQEAKEIAQEAWIRLVEKQRAGDLDHLSLPGLAIAQATWLAREASRSRARRRAIAPVSSLDVVEQPPVPDPAVDLERRILDREQLSMAFRALAACSERDQAIFRAAYGEAPRSHADIAADMGLSLQRTRQILCEVRARLRDAVSATRRMP